VFVSADSVLKETCVLKKKLMIICKKEKINNSITHKTIEKTIIKKSEYLSSELIKFKIFDIFGLKIYIYWSHNYIKFQFQKNLFHKV